MKFRTGKMSLILRVGTMAGVLLFGQQAMAIGTAAGTQVDNTVTVGYDVGGIGQTDLTDSVSFVVDRRVDFSLVAQGAALVDVTPGVNDYFFDFLLTNDSNSPLDFSIALNELVGGTVRGDTDDANMGLVDYAVSASPVSGTDDDPVRAGPQFVDQLAADDSIRIRVFGDAALAMANGQIAGVQLDAIGREPASGAATALAEDANTDAGIENVFADTDNDNIESDFDGFRVVSADLTVTKSYTVVGGGLPIPGATVEYTITAVNASTTTAASNIVLNDVLTDVDGAVSLVLNSYAGEDVSLVNGASTLACDVEINGDGDGCDLNVAGTLSTITVGAVGITTPIDVAASTTLTIQYQVLIADPAITP